MPATAGQDALAADEGAEILRARSRAASAIAAARTALENLETAIRGRVSALAPGAAPAAASVRALPRSRLPALQAVPEVTPELTAQEILAVIGTYGIRQASYGVVVPATAPNPINSTGNFYDARDVYDAWILNPSIDTKIDFDKMPSQNTPFIAANTFMQFQIRKQKVWYLAQNPGTVGVMQVWLLRY